MKKFALVALVACFAWLTVAATPAQAQVLMKVDVPFDFSAGYGVLSAGSYEVSRTSNEAALLLSSGRRGVELMLPLTIEQRNSFEIPELVFHRYGNEYFLAEIWTSSDGTVRTLAVHPRERQLAKAGSPLQVAVVHGVPKAATGK